jgi:hypothetical protein
MLFNCSACTALTPEFAERYGSPQDFVWAHDRLGDLPAQWNVCVNYDAPREDAKLVHFTQGVPIWHECADSAYAKEWLEEREDMLRICSWRDIMAASVHARPVLERMMQNYGKAIQQYHAQRQG